jgi:hypothetical protein
MIAGPMLRQASPFKRVALTDWADAMFALRQQLKKSRMRRSTISKL